MRRQHELVRVARFSITALVFRILWALVKVLIRFVIGAPMNGDRTTDATFFSAGSRRVGEANWWGPKNPTAWSKLPGYKVTGIRFAVVAAAGVALRWPTQFLVALVVVAGVVLGLAVWRAVESALSYNHNRLYVRPLHVALAADVGHGPDVEPRDWLEIPPNFTDDDAVIRLLLPGTYKTDLNKHVLKVVTERLGIAETDVDMKVDPVGETPTFELRRAPRAPELVRFEDVRELVEAAPESAPLIGLGRRGQAVSTDMDAESPHTLLSMAPGAGKSMFARGQIAQVLHNGGQAVILDPKRHSHRWLRGLDGVIYLRDTEDLHNGLLWLAAEAERRNRFADDLNDDSEMAAAFTRFYIVAEEMNVLVNRLQKWWKKNKGKDEPANSPAVDALHELLFMGRAVKINVLAISQMGTARALGGTEARETFSTRALGRYTVNNWRMLVPEVWPMPKSSDKRGRIQVVRAGNADETQVTKWTEEEARDWASSGRPNERPKLALTLPPEGEALGLSQQTGDDDQLDQADAVESAGPAAPELVTLRQAAESGIVAVSDDPKKALEILRAARKRDPEFPPGEDSGAQKLYRPDELERWARNRPRAGVREIEKVSD